MTEGKIKDDFMGVARMLVPAFVWLRHEDKWTSGVPDLTATGRGFTSWWEFKHAVEGKDGELHFPSDGIQELTMKRLAQQGRAFYLIYCTHGRADRSVRVVAPCDLADWENCGIWTSGFDHEWVVKHIYERHQ